MTHMARDNLFGCSHGHFSYTGFFFVGRFVFMLDRKCNSEKEFSTSESQGEIHEKNLDETGCL